MKLFINTLIIFNSSDMSNMKILKTRKDLIEYMEKEKMNVIVGINSLIQTIEQRFDITKQMYLKNILRKVQKLKVLLSSSTNHGKLLTLLQIIIENSFKQFEPVSVAASPKKKYDHGRHKTVMFDFKKASVNTKKKPRLDMNYNNTNLL